MYAVVNVNSRRCDLSLPACLPEGPLAPYKATDGAKVGSRYVRLSTWLSPQQVEALLVQVPD